MTCLGIIPDSFIACGEGHGAERQFCSDVCMLRAALAPFAKAAADHGVRSASKDDLWVSLGVPSSAWVLAMKALESGAIPARPEPKCAGCGRGVYDCEALMALGGDVFVCEVCDEMARKSLPTRCTEHDYNDVRCELPYGHEGQCACPKALATFNGTG